MLLGRSTGPAHRGEPESGSAMAAVVGILALTGIIAATLLATTMFATGFTTATRASVQAQAAAEAGLDYAEANLALCAGGALASPAGTRPEFSLTVEHRTTAQAAWVAGCPPRGALEVRVVSTGRAETPGAAGHTRGDKRSMVAILRSQMPRAVVGDRGLRSAGSLDASYGGLADMSTNGDFVCNGEVLHTGTLYVDGQVNPTRGGDMCGRTGPVLTGDAVDPTSRFHAFPRLYRNDPRWPTTLRSVSWLATTLGSIGPDPCTITVAPPLPVVLPSAVPPQSTQPVLVDATSCTGAAGLTLSVDGTVSLSADVVIMVNKLTTAARKTMVLQSYGAGAHTLSLIKPWPTDRVGGCPDIPGADFQTADLNLQGNMRMADTRAAVFLYSSTGLLTGPDSGKNPLNGQIYGCKVNLQGAANIRFVPTGPMRMVSKRDLPVTG